MRNIKKILCAAVMSAALAVVCQAASAQTKHYVITNDNNLKGNTATVYQLTTGGTLNQLQVLQTGGLGGTVESPAAAITPNGQCLFVSNEGSSDIAAFALPSFTKIGNFSNPNLIAARPGEGADMGLALDPAGAYLFAQYTSTSDQQADFPIASWNIGQDCSLTLGSITTKVYSVSAGPLEAVPGGKLISSVATDFAGWSTQQTLYAVGAGGVLSVIGNFDTNDITGCGICQVYAIDITNDGTMAIFAAQRAVITAQITDSGFSNIKPWWLVNPVQALGLWLSPAAAAGNGYLYATGGTLQSPRAFAMATAQFSENPVNLSIVNQTPNESKADYGAIQTVTPSGTGAALEVIGFQNHILVYKVDSSTGALTVVSSTTDNQSKSLPTIVAYPLR